MLDDIVVSLTLVVLVSFIPLDARARMLCEIMSRFQKNIEHLFEVACLSRFLSVLHER